MKIILATLLLSMSIISISHSMEKSDSKKFEKRKAKMITRIDRRIEISEKRLSQIKAYKSCVQQASSKEDYKSCKEQHMPKRNKGQRKQLKKQN